MTDACESHQAGYHFEEGGCWGMALALYDAFSLLGKQPQIVLRTDTVHSMVSVDGVLYDYQGESVRPYETKSVSPSEMMEIAAARGVSEGDVLNDKDWALDVIRAAGDMACEECAREGVVS